MVGGLVDHYLHVRAGDGVSFRTGELEPPPWDVQPRQRARHVVWRHAEIERRGQEHVPGDPSDGLEQQQSRAPHGYRFPFVRETSAA